MNRNYEVVAIEDAVVTRDVIRDTQIAELKKQYEKDGVTIISLDEFIN